jgi:hypothetical protein
VSEPRRLPFVQVDLAGTIGLDPGRYLARPPEGPEQVLVVAVAGASPPVRRRFRRERPRYAEPDAAGPDVPLTTLTIVRPEPFADHDAARSWLEGLRADADALASEIERAIPVANRALHARRTSTLDHALADVTTAHALAARAGYGLGDDLADGRFEAAVELPQAARKRRGEMLAPQERIAAVLAWRERISPCEELVVRARADVDAGRGREAALQLRAALEALLADRDSFDAADQDRDLAALQEARAAIAEAAEDALDGELSAERTSQVAETLRISERVLRRQRAAGLR